MVMTLADDSGERTGDGNGDGNGDGKGRDGGAEKLGGPRVLTQETLQTVALNTRGRERGSIVLDGEWQFIRAPELEGVTFSVAREMVVPNPDQPRTYFSKQALERLAVTMGSEGQKQAILVIPILNLHDNSVGLFIIDGERRHRSAGNLGLSSENIEVRWEPSIEKLLTTSFLTNDAREGHNPIEKALLYKKLLGYQEQRGMEGTRAIENVAASLGIGAQAIRNHLKLLDLPDEIQKLVARGIITPSAVKGFDHYRHQKGFDRKLFVAQLLKAAEDAGFSLNDEDADGASGDKEVAEGRAATAAGVGKAAGGNGGADKKGVVGKDSDADGDDGEGKGERTKLGKGAGKTLAHTTINRALLQSIRDRKVAAVEATVAEEFGILLENLTRVRKAVEEVTGLDDRAVSSAMDKDLLPIEPLLRKLKQVREAVDMVCKKVQGVYTPTSVDVNDRLRFSQILSSSHSHRVLGEGTRRKTVLFLAEAASNENGGLVTLKDLYEHTGLDHAAFNHDLPLLKEVLRGLGLDLEEGVIPVIDEAESRLRKYHALRLILLAPAGGAARADGAAAKPE